MYSRDIFPRYSSGGLPIPENYSGNAIRRMPQGGDPTRNRGAAENREGGGRGNGQKMSPSSTSSPQVHTPAPRTGGTRQGSGVRPAEAPLSVTPSFAAQNGRREEDDLHGSMQGEDPSQQMTPPEEDGAGDDRRDTEGDGLRGGGAEEGSSLGRETHGEGQNEPAAAVSAGDHPVRHDGGFGSFLSAFLPPKIGGGGALSQVGLEEALLLGLFLLLSQSEEEDDTLMLLALLFLYR